MRFASFLSVGFITTILVNLPERRLAKRTSVQCITKVSIASCQPNLMKTYHNEANPSGITKIVSKIFLELFEQSS